MLNINAKTILQDIIQVRKSRTTAMSSAIKIILLELHNTLLRAFIYIFFTFGFLLVSILRDIQGKWYYIQIKGKENQVSKRSGTRLKSCPSLAECSFQWISLTLKIWLESSSQQFFYPAIMKLGSCLQEAREIKTST